MVKHATIHDVAQLCNVSVASVSRVLAKADYPVSDALRTRVLEAAAQLGYIPNAASRALKAHATNEVGVIIPNITNPCYAQLVKGIQDAAQMRGYHVLLYNSYRNPGQEAANIDMLLQKRVDGILIASISSDLSAIRRAMDVGCPVITMEQELNLPCIHVGYDYVRGGYLATEHLLLNGHRKIAFVGAPLDRPSRVQMLTGYRRCLREHGIAESPDYVLLSDSEQDAGDIYELRNGSRAADRFVAMENRPTACVCLNDITALGLMSALRKRGVKVPGICPWSALITSCTASSPPRADHR